MPVETATLPHQLNPEYPLSDDQIEQGDNHLRLIKTTLKNAFENVTGKLESVFARITGAAFTGPLSSTGDITAGTAHTGARLSHSGSDATFENLGSGDFRFLADGASAATLKRDGGLTHDKDIAVRSEGDARWARLGANNTFTSDNTFTNDVYFDHPTAGHVKVDWQNDYLRYRFGGSSTPAGLRLDNYDNVSITLNRDGSADFTNRVRVQGGTVWHDGNDGPGSGLHADMVDGFHVSQGSGANTIVARNSSGDIYGSTGHFTHIDIPDNGTVGTGNDQIRFDTSGRIDFLIHGAWTAHLNDTGLDLRGRHLKLSGGRIQLENTDDYIDFNDSTNVLTVVVDGSYANSTIQAGHISLSNGSAGSPAYSFDTDGNTGFFLERSNAGEIAVSLNGSRQGLFEPGVNSNTNQTVITREKGDVRYAPLPYPGGDAGKTLFPVGTVLAVNGNNINRNYRVYPCLSTSDNDDFVMAGASNAGSPLVGVWRARGEINGSDSTLVQRTE